MKFKYKKILITGGTGFLGKSVYLKFKEHLTDKEVYHIRAVGSKAADLRSFRETEKLISGMDLVIHLAADCGGIGYNRENPGQLFYNNMLMGLNMVEACRRGAIKKLVLIGSVCGYPKYTKVPFKENNLWDGYPEETNAPYGLAKRDLLVMAQSYRKQYGLNAIYLLIVNLYGIYDVGFFDDNRSHVVPALVKKFVEAKEAKEEQVVLWGTGKPTREFLYVEDAAEAIFLASKLYDKPAPVNIGAGFEISIRELAEEIKSLVDYEGEITWDASKPDGQPRRCLDVTKALELFNFKAHWELRNGLKKTIDWYLEQRKNKPILADVIGVDKTETIDWNKPKGGFDG